MKVNVLNGTMKSNEINYYIQHIRENNPGMEIDKLDLEICDDGYVEANYLLSSVPVERIRRITGYLVGTLDRFNNAKRAEEQDRVKHMKVS